MRACPPLPEPTGRGGSAPRRPTRLRVEEGGSQGTDLRSSDRWVGSRPPSSAHCPWCRQRPAATSGEAVAAPAAGRRARAGAGWGDAATSRGAPGAEGVPPPRRGAGGGEWGAPTGGHGRAKRSSAAARSSPASSGGIPGRARRGAAGFSCAGRRRAAPLSLTRSRAAGSLLPGRGLAAPVARGRQFRVRGPPPPAPGRAGRLASETRVTPL